MKFRTRNSSQLNNPNNLSKTMKLSAKIDPQLKDLVEHFGRKELSQRISTQLKNLNHPQQQKWAYSLRTSFIFLITINLSTKISAQPKNLTFPWHEKVKRKVITMSLLFISSLKDFSVHKAQTSTKIMILIQGNLNLFIWIRAINITNQSTFNSI